MTDRVLNFHRAEYDNGSYALFCTDNDGEPLLIKVKKSSIFERPQRTGRYHFSFVSLTAPAPYDYIMESCKSVTE